jgi:predicted RNA-binding Zn-ribbon protein involved in translation (DUF1610 family)
MNTMTDWWSKKLAGEKPTAPRPNLPPVESPVRFPQAQNPPNRVTSQQPDPNVKPESFSEALRMGYTKGGEAARQEQTCPDCGSGYVFTRAKGNMQNGASPAPRCYECGWNGMYDQASQSAWSK